MKSGLKILFAIFLLVSATGCANSNFKTRIPDAQLTLGQDTEQIIRQKLGKPYGEKTMKNDDKLIKILTYVHSRPTMKTTFIGGVKPTRNQIFYFYNDKLIGYSYVSIAEQDIPNFDETKVKEIKKKVTTQDEVIKLLGLPQGRQIYPLTKKEDEHIDFYRYAQVNGIFEMKAFQKSLGIIYDKNNVVVDTDYFELDEK